MTTKIESSGGKLVLSDGGQTEVDSYLADDSTRALLKGIVKRVKHGDGATTFYTKGLHTVIVEMDNGVVIIPDSWSGVRVELPDARSCSVEACGEEVKISRG